MLPSKSKYKKHIQLRLNSRYTSQLSGLFTDKSITRVKHIYKIVTRKIEEGQQHIYRLSRSVDKRRRRSQ